MQAVTFASALNDVGSWALVAWQATFYQRVFELGPDVYAPMLAAIIPVGGIIGGVGGGLAGDWLSRRGGRAWLTVGEHPSFMNLHLVKDTGCHRGTCPRHLRQLRRRPRRQLAVSQGRPRLAHCRCVFLVYETSLCPRIQDMPVKPSPSLAAQVHCIVGGVGGGLAGDWLSGKGGRAWLTVSGDLDGIPGLHQPLRVEIEACMLCMGRAERGTASAGPRT